MAKNKTLLTIAMLCVALMFVTAVTGAAGPYKGSFDPYGISLINAASPGMAMEPFSQIYGTEPGAVTGTKFAPVIEYGLTNPRYLYGYRGPQYGGGPGAEYRYEQNYAGPEVQAIRQASRMNILAISGFLDSMFSPGFGDFNTGVLAAPKALREKWAKESAEPVIKKPPAIENASKTTSLT